MLIMGAFLDDVKGNEECDSEKKSFCSVFFATFKQLKDYRQALLIPLTTFIGLEISFLTGDYTSVSWSNMTRPVVGITASLV